MASAPRLGRGWAVVTADALMMARPRLVDLFCGAGGAGMGYYRAGFEVVGVDVKKQPRYPFEFVRADALEYLSEHGTEFVAAHASPPCLDHTRLSAVTGGDGSGWLLGATREALRVWGGHWVIENVPGATMDHALRLCGTEFGAAGARPRRRGRGPAPASLLRVERTTHGCGWLPARGRRPVGWRLRPCQQRTQAGRAGMRLRARRRGRSRADGH